MNYELAAFFYVFILELDEMNDRALHPYATYIVVMTLNIADEESCEDRAATLITTD